MIVPLGFGIFYSCLSPEQETNKQTNKQQTNKKHGSCKMTNAKIICKYGFLSPIFWTALFHIKIQVTAQYLRFVIFHLCNPEDDGTNVKCCQHLCFSTDSDSGSPRLTKMKDLSEHGPFKIIQVIYMYTWKRKCGVYKGTCWVSACIFVCVFVCPDSISQVKLVWLFEPSF